jgi:hypothetical protein
MCVDDVGVFGFLPLDEAEFGEAVSGCFVTVKGLNVTLPAPAPLLCEPAWVLSPAIATLLIIKPAPTSAKIFNAQARNAYRGDMICPFICNATPALGTD